MLKHQSRCSNCHSSGNNRDGARRGFARSTEHEGEEDSIDETSSSSSDKSQNEPDTNNSRPASSRLKRRASARNHQNPSATTSSSTNIGTDHSTNSTAPATLLAPHFFLPGSSGSFILAGLNGSSGAIGGGHVLPLFGAGHSSGSAGQFASLTPDARACVTATYLCVLIVNNTWLDCNLLDTLCNNGTGGSSSNSRQSSSSTNRDQDDLALRDAQNASKWLANGRRDEFLAEGALESALSGLVAFAGGGTYSSEEDEGGGRAASTSARATIMQSLDAERNSSAHALDKNRVYFLPIKLSHPSEPDKSRQVPIILHDTGGGGGGDIGLESSADLDAQASLYAADDSSASGYGTSDLGDIGFIDNHDQRYQWSPLVQQQVPRSGPPERLERLMDEDKNRIFEQYLKLRKYQALRVKKQKQQQEQRRSHQSDGPLKELAVDTSAAVISDERAANSTAHVDTNVVASATREQSNNVQAQTNTTPLPTGLVQWVGRPFRGWGSYAFWPSSATQADPSSVSLNNLSQNSRQQQQVDSLSSLNAVVGDASNKQNNGMQLLRPIDRSEQYNDIPTNTRQSGVKHSQQERGVEVVDDQPRRGHPIFSSLVSDYSATTPSILSTPPMDYEPPNGNNNDREHLVHQQHYVSSTMDPSALGLSTNGVAFNQAQRSVCKCDILLDISGDCRIECLRVSQQQVSTVPSILVTMSNPGYNSDSGPMVPSSSSYGAPKTIAATAVSPPTTGTTLMTSSSSPVASASGKMNPVDVTFLLYTRHNRELAQDLTHFSLMGTTAIVSPSPASASGSTFAKPAMGIQEQDPSGLSEITDLVNETNLSINSSLPIKIIIHGFGSGGRRPWVSDMVYKLLDYEDVNVIVVDWEKGAVLPNYVQAAGNTRIVGHKIATLIKSINAKYGLTGNRYHLIGFSLGAHVAGFAGMEIRNSTSISRHWINRITGLDPASPLFEGYEANDRLDPSDAQFVDVIHSNGDGVLRGGFGSLQPMGHVDFYPNGGRVQVGCNSVLLSALSDIIYGKWQSLCNHRRALNFFMDSFEFSRCRFRSFNCDSYENYLRGDCFDCGVNNEKCSYMGYLANYSKGRGKMYLTTHEEAPFCANQFIIKIIGSKGYKTHWGKVEVTLVTVDGKNESFWLSSINSGQTSTVTSSSSTTSSSTSLSSSSTSPSPSMLPSSHELSPTMSQKELSQQSMQSLIVAHPTLVNFTQILLRYTKYKGWIYSGDENWPIDKVFITDSDGQVKSFCGHNTILESHITTRLNLEPGNCTVIDSQSSTSTSASSSVATTSSPASTAITSGAIGRASLTTGANVGHSASSGQHGGGVLNGQQHSVRTPRLLVSMMHHQSSSAGGGEHHHQAQSQSPILLNHAHTATIQRMLSPHQQFSLSSANGNAGSSSLGGGLHQTIAHQILAF